MVYSKSVKNKVRDLRKYGFSLGQIHNKTKVPKTTIRTWISNIILSKEYKDALRKHVQSALQKGRRIAQKLNKENRISLEKSLFNKGKSEIGQLNSRELFLVGIALYWGEGFKNKYERRLGFCNSDPLMIGLYIYWLNNCLGIKKEELIVRLTLNYSYKERVDEMQNYWSNLLGISPKQFVKPFYQTSKWKKQYNTDNYHGVLRIHVKDSLKHLLTMKGWIEGLRSNVVK